MDSTRTWIEIVTLNSKWGGNLPYANPAAGFSIAGMILNFYHLLQTKTYNLGTQKGAAFMDSAFFLLIPGKIDFFQGDEVGLMFDFMIEEDG